MSTKLKGVFKGLKLISQIFVVKEAPSNDIQIGYPTDVKHVAHIGWESPTGPSSSPSWMQEGTISSTGTPDNSRGNSREPSWASQDFENSRDGSVYSLFSENSCSDAVPCPDIPKPPRTSRRKKSKSKSKANSPSSSARSSKSSKSSKSKETLSATSDDANDIRTEIRFV